MKPVNLTDVVVLVLIKQPLLPHQTIDRLIGITRHIIGKELKEPL